MILHEVGNNKKLSCGYKYNGDELSPKGMNNRLPDPFNLKAKESKQQTKNGFPPYRELVDNVNRKSYGRRIGVIN